MKLPLEIPRHFSIKTTSHSYKFLPTVSCGGVPYPTVNSYKPKHKTSKVPVPSLFTYTQVLSFPVFLWLDVIYCDASVQICGDTY